MEILKMWETNNHYLKNIYLNSLKYDNNLKICHNFSVNLIMLRMFSDYDQQFDNSTH